MKKLLVVSAVWCPSCLILNKHLKKLNEDIEIEITKLDYDLDEDIVEEYNVGEKLPVVILLDNDKEVSRLIGEKTYDELLSFVKESK
jgi:thiol-disulfide isomerase/thioredoxin